MVTWRMIEPVTPSTPASPPGTDGPGSRPRKIGTMGMVVLASLLPMLLWSCTPSDAASEAPQSPTALNPVSGSVPQPVSDPDGVTARDSVRGPIHNLAGEPLSTGLEQHGLSEGHFNRVKPLLGQAEATLIGIYQLISQGQHRDALAQASQLVREYPNFHLAHLVHGDLLSLRVRPVSEIGDVPATQMRAGARQLADLRDESRRRLLALTERPPEGSVPAQFLRLSNQSRHAIAVDASRSRLYLFENETRSNTSGQFGLPPQLKLLGDFYISVGLSGIEKSVEGDKRTPLGVYYITSSLPSDKLPDLYGVGALPINYPNPLDVQRGKTGSGIWLHGTPKEQFVRAPQASDGCVVLSNPDLEKLLRTVQIRTTPVVIAPTLTWVKPADLEAERLAFERTLESWRSAKSASQIEQFKSLYSPHLFESSREQEQWWARHGSDLRQSHGQRDVTLKDVSILRWEDSQDTMVVTFGEVAEGQRTGVTRRQYWKREDAQWKIFHEGTP